MLGQFTGLIGIFSILLTAYAFSVNRSKIRLDYALKALIFQVILCVLILKTSFGQTLFSYCASAVVSLQDFAGSGAGFVFGELADPAGPWKLIFAIKVASLIIFFSAFMSLLFHIGVIQVVVSGISKVIRPFLGTAGAETLCAVANILLGQTEAPLLVKNYISSMSDSQIFLVMVSGMATISGAILAVYASLGIPVSHLLTASVMAVPSSILISKILMPETEADIEKTDQVAQPTTSNVIDAISTGTTDGLGLALNVMAMLISFISLIAMANFLMAKITTLIFGTAYTFETILGFIFSFVARIIGIPGSESLAAGSVLGKKLIINEFVGYMGLLKANLSERSLAIMTYALCGFASLPSIGIQIGGLGSLVPSKRGVLIRLGLRALLGGTLVNLLNAAVVSLFI
ncbi:NupC/NupG family nucleoside CNT transporter [Candidatus Dependentiae bacterium]